MRRRQGGFTLIELLIVVVLVAATAAVAAYSMRTQTGEKAPAFARGVIAAAHEARHAALTLGLPARLRFVPGATTGRVISERANPNQAAVAAATEPPWIELGGGLVTPADVDFCEVRAGLAAGLPICPLAAQRALCFMPNGRVFVVDPVATPACAPPLPASLGAQVFLRSIDDKKHYKMIVWGLTGLPRLTDQW